MVEFSIPRFNRRYVWIPATAAAVLIVASFMLIEARVQASTNAATVVRESQERLRLLANVAYAVVDAESSQRGFLLTRDQTYLDPYQEARQRLNAALSELRTAYQSDPVELPRVAAIGETIDRKLVEMQQTIELVDFTGSTTQSMRVVRTGAGLRYMSVVRDELEQMSAKERQRAYVAAAAWDAQKRLNRFVTAGGALTILSLLGLGAFFTTRDIERRTAAATELDHLVTLRTSELSELSTHLQQITERERAHLARELHDELGGLLVSIKMDLAQLAKRIDISQPDTAERWQRILKTVHAGVDLKRRVIEQLRPTLLDNMGLIAALQWQAQQLCESAGIKLRMSVPEQEPALHGNVSIAIFRIAQETLINMVKHSRATTATLELQVQGHELTLLIQDNGVGIPEYPSRRSAHGLMSMRHRARSIGASFEVSATVPNGTATTLRLSLVKSETEVA